MTTTKKKPTKVTSQLKGLHLHFDPLSGIAGDMTVAALVDLGVPAKVVVDAVKAMKVPGLKVGFERRKRGAFAGLGFLVDWPGKDEPHQHHHHEHAHHDHDHDHDHDNHGHSHEHRDHAEIRRLIARAALGRDVKELALAIFERLAKVEARLHGVPVAKVAFHEVGAFDSIADIVGAAAAIAWLEPSSITSTPVVVGTGTVWTDHGRVAIPAPATAALLQEVPVRAEGEGELTTPTGAAILAVVVDEFRELPPVVLRGQGYGAGTWELADRANVLRVTLGQAVGQALAPPPTDVWLVQANLDDMNPQLVEPLMSALFDAGALDVWVTPILMKKGRPALEVSALVKDDPSTLTRAAVVGALFGNSTSFGVRWTPYQRSVLTRSMAQVDTRFGKVAVKLGGSDGKVVSATAEFEDCRRLARKAGVPVKDVLREAAAAANRLVPRPRGKR